MAPKKRKAADTVQSLPKRVNRQKKSPVGILDEEAKNLLSGIAVSPDIYLENGNIFDVMLIQVNIQMNTDKFYILQLIRDGADIDNCFVFFRWGRTGTKGQHKLDGPFPLGDAIKNFESKFLEKTGNNWNDRKNFKVLPKKYNMVNIDYSKKLLSAQSLTKAKWEYYVDDFVDGKATGWYEFTSEGSEGVEDLWVVYQSNTAYAQRVVESGAYQYLVDLVKMTQLNVTLGTGKVRWIRRSYNGGITSAPGAPTGSTMPVPLSTVLSSLATVAQSQSSTMASALTTPSKQPNTVTHQSTMAAPSPPSASKRRPVDSNCPLVSSSSTVTVVDDYDCTLNQVDLSSNANKFYRLQLLQTSPSCYYVWTRWGRVGDTGQSACQSFSTLPSAVSAFESKFREKTGNKWIERHDFKLKDKKYDMLAMKDSDNQSLISSCASPAATIAGSSQAWPPSKLPVETQYLVSLILDQDMFKDTLVSMNLDLTRMPLGALSVAQVAKGYSVLEEIKKILVPVSVVPVKKAGGKGKGGRRAKAKGNKGDVDDAGPSVPSAGAVTALTETERAQRLSDLSGSFYQTVPHSFPRHVRPPAIQTLEALNEKYELLATLQDIAMAQDMMATAQAMTGSRVSEHPLDVKYRELDASLDLVTSGPLRRAIVQYVASTKGYYSNIDIEHVWAVRRSPEETSFSQFSDLSNHRLLWHGTNVAVVAAILKAGLRIMPSVNGGRVGRGIYMANELSKSAAYVRTTTDSRGRRIGVLFLVEAALGKMLEIYRYGCPYGHCSCIG